MFWELGDERELALAERRLGLALLHQGRVEEECTVLERALVHADASDDRRARRTVIASLVSALFNGPAPVVDAIRRFEELLESTGSDRVLEATVTRGLSAMLAMAGRFDEARELVGKSSLVLDELNLLTRSVYRSIAATAKELVGDRVGAEHELTARWKSLSGMRSDAVDARAMNAASDLAYLYCDEGRWEDAERCLDYGRDVLEIKSLFVAAPRFAVSARVAAHRGEYAQALELAQRGVALAERSDMLNLRARLWLALAEVQRHAGAESDARTAVAAALDLYEKKGNVAAAAIVRAST
jgi:tetratricopeptide (TPR) repeat protein